MFTLYNILKLIMMIIHAYIFGNIYIYITTFLQAKEWYILTKFQLIIQILQDIIA
jgi:hypothetical protein